MRANLNRALAFARLAAEETGVLVSVEKANTLTEAQRRASELRVDLEHRKVHPDFLRFCEEELLKDNCFHGVREVIKSVADKLRTRTGLTDDGDLSPKVHPARGGILFSFEPVWLGDATGRDAEPSTQRSVPSCCIADAVSLA